MYVFVPITWRYETLLHVGSCFVFLPVDSHLVLAVWTRRSDLSDWFVSSDFNGWLRVLVLCEDEFIQCGLCLLLANWSELGTFWWWKRKCAKDVWGRQIRLNVGIYKEETVKLLFPFVLKNTILYQIRKKKNKKKKKRT